MRFLLLKDIMEATRSSTGWPLTYRSIRMKMPAAMARIAKIMLGIPIPSSVRPQRMSKIPNNRKPIL